MNFSYHAAAALAAAAHGTQLDSSGAPYIFHPLRVAHRLTGELDRIAAVLHDVVEDTELSADDLRAAGVPEAAVVAVVALTRVDGESRSAYLARVAANARATRVKRADMADNTDPARLAMLPPKRAAYYVAKYADCSAQLDVLAR